MANEEEVMVVYGFRTLETRTETLEEPGVEAVNVRFIELVEGFTVQEPSAELHTEEDWMLV